MTISLQCSSNALQMHVQCSLNALSLHFRLFCYKGAHQKNKMKVWISSRLFVDPLKEGDLAEPCVGVLLLGPPGAGVLPGSKEYWVYYGMLHLEVKSTS